MTGVDSEMPLVRRIGNTVFATLVSVLSNRRVTDSASGQRVIRRDKLAKLYPLPDGLNFTPVMSTRAMYEDIRIVEVPITYSERVGRSKLAWQMGCVSGLILMTVNLQSGAHLWVSGHRFSWMGGLSAIGAPPPQQSRVDRNWSPVHRPGIGIGGHQHLLHWHRF
jgi:hypothetical protein